MKRLSAAAVVVVASLLPLGASAARAADRTVYEVAISGPVDPLVARYAQRSLHRAEDSGAAAVILRLDTPGGLDSSMRRIVKSVLASRVPVICWVGPAGARAASAGTFILLGCPVAAMAPGTNVGAAHPVGITGDVLDQKATNDAAAYIRSLAERWGRNADWAERAVRHSVSASADEARQLHVVDLVARDRRQLLADVDDRRVRTAAGDVSPHLAGADVRTLHLTAAEALLHDLVDPNLAFLLFILGVAGLVFEVLHPGLNLPGVIGLLLLVAAMVILGMLPVNVAGLLLLLAAFGFFVLDLKVAGHGLPTAAGIVSLILGGLLLFNPSVPNARVSRTLIVSVALVKAAVFWFVVRAALVSRRRPVAAGPEALVGLEGVVVTDLDPTGVVQVRGESWTAHTVLPPVPAGARVIVMGVRGLTVQVVPVVPSELEVP